MSLSKKITVDRKLMKWHLDIGWKKCSQDKKFHNPLRIILKQINLLVIHDIDILAFDSQHRLYLFTFKVILLRNSVWILFNLKSNYVKFIATKYPKIALRVKICIKKKSKKLSLPHDPLKGSNSNMKKKKKTIFHLGLFKRIFYQHKYTLLHAHVKICSGTVLKQ